MKYTELSEDLRNLIEAGISDIVANYEYNWEASRIRGRYHTEQTIKDEEIEFEDGFAYVTICVKGTASHYEADYYNPSSDSCDLDYEVKSIAIDMYEGRDVVESVDVELDKVIAGNIYWDN